MGRDAFRGQELGMCVCVCVLLREDLHGSEASLSYTVRAYLKQKRKREKKNGSS